MAEGTLLAPDLEPEFDSPAGKWALGYLRDLYANGSVPHAVPDWHFDDVSASFRNGSVAITGDWPGYFGLHRDPAHSVAAEHLAIARYPVGGSGTRRVYAGSHSFAITRDCRDIPAAVALLHELTTFESQMFEAERGVFPARQDVLAAIRQAMPAGTLESERLQLLELTVREDMLMFPELASYPDIEDAVWPMLQAGITGVFSVSEALSRAVAATRAIVRTP
jgi:multiple sugar transport system substrate-binding protein